MNINISEKVKTVLDLRLASGEITSDEYDSLFEKISEQSQLKSQQSNVNDIEEPILRYKEEVKFYKSYFIHLGVSYCYSQISDVKLTDFEHVVNFISILPEWNLFIYITGRENPITISAKSLAIKTQKFYFLRKAYQFINQHTSKGQVQQIIFQLQQKGIIEITKDIFINYRGWITDRKVQYALSEILKNGTIEFTNLEERSFFNGGKKIYKHIFIISPYKNANQDLCIIFQAGHNCKYSPNTLIHIFQNFDRYLKYMPTPKGE